MSTLCVVDDDIIFQRIIKITLIKYPVFKHVIYYSHGKSLVKYLIDNINDFSNLPDAVFLDLNMPDFDGWAVLDALQKFYDSLCKKIAVYVVSASIMERDRTRAMTYSFVKDFIIKPIGKDKLTEISDAVRHTQSI
jgi:CheY-like chemotaxis protein